MTVPKSGSRLSPLSRNRRRREESFNSQIRWLLVIITIIIIVCLNSIELSWLSKSPPAIIAPGISITRSTSMGGKQFINAPCQATLRDQYYLHHNISRDIPGCFIGTVLQQLPQNLTFGAFSYESAFPFISSDIWADLVDNKRTFFVREWEDGFIGYTELKKWIASKRHQITLIFNNNVDISWPANLDADDWKDMLCEPNLHAVFVGGLRQFDSECMSKVKPLPLGPKWQYQSTNLFGEAKSKAKNIYALVSDTPEESERLFELPTRTNTVWVRPMSNSNVHSNNYEKSNPALTTPRNDVAQILMASAPNSTVLHSEDSFLDQLSTSNN